MSERKMFEISVENNRIALGGSVCFLIEDRSLRIGIDLPFLRFEFDSGAKFGLNFWK